MEIILKNKDKIKVNVVPGDIFYSKYTNSYLYLTPTHEDDDDETMYSLVVLSSDGLYYSSEYANIGLDDIVSQIEKDEELIHYSIKKYDFKLTIEEKSGSL